MSENQSRDDMNLKEEEEVEDRPKYQTSIGGPGKLLLSSTSQCAVSTKGVVGASVVRPFSVATRSSD